MKLRLPSALLLVLYVAVACCFGVVHDHHHGHENCAACAWLIHSITDAPAPVVHFVPAFVPHAVDIPEAVVLVSPVVCATASRAPPLASA